MSNNDLSIRVHSFYQQPDPVKDGNGKETGEIVVRDYVAYGPPQAMDRQVVHARVDRILKATAPVGNNMAQHSAWARAEFIRPLYEAWKRGEELPETGMPIAACNFLRSEEVALLKRSGIRTVEELAEMRDADLAAIKLPAMREKRAQAARFLEAQDTNKAAAQMAARDAQLAEQAAEIAELKAMMESMTRPNPEDESDDAPRRGPGRPRKQPEMAA